MHDTLEDISLTHDNGEDMRFRGSLSSECSWYDEEHGMLCRQKLYVTEDKDQIYYIMRTGAEGASVNYCTAKKSSEKGMRICKSFGQPYLEDSVWMRVKIQ